MTALNDVLYGLWGVLWVHGWLVTIRLWVTMRVFGRIVVVQLSDLSTQSAVA